MIESILHTIIAFALVIFSFNKAVFAHSICQIFPENSNDPIVETCESESSYKIRVGNQTSIYDKKEFKKNVKDQITNWLVETSFPIGQICNSKVEYWLSVPDANPYASQARILVSNTYKNFLLYLPPRIEEWKIENNNVTILNNEYYPDRQGYFSGNISIKRKETTKSEELDQYLKKYAITPSGNEVGLWRSYYTSAFSENNVLRQIKYDRLSNLLIEDLGLEYAFEWGSRKIQSFYFNWSCEQEKTEE
ncbi:MAG: hypothetical protein R3B45_18330 [Bdellovibrionota bacterium]